MLKLSKKRSIDLEILSYSKDETSQLTLKNSNNPSHPPNKCMEILLRSKALITSTRTSSYQEIRHSFKSRAIKQLILHETSRFRSFRIKSNDWNEKWASKRIDLKVFTLVLNPLREALISSMCTANRIKSTLGFTKTLERSWEMQRLYFNNLKSSLKFDLILLQAN